VKYLPALTPPGMSGAGYYQEPNSWEIALTRFEGGAEEPIQTQAEVT